MHDSGCGKSVMCKEIFESIPGYKDIPITQLKNVFVKSCSGEQERISGHVALRFSFEGDNGNKVSFIHDVLITDYSTLASLRKSFYWLLSKAVRDKFSSFLIRHRKKL
jgi:hypothetical protein